MIVPCYMYSVPMGAYPPFRIKDEAWAREAVLDRFKRTGIPTESLWGTQLCPTEETIILEIPEASGPFGAKGIGEVSMVPTAPAIANAVYQATGVRAHALPIAPELLARQSLIR